MLLRLIESLGYSGIYVTANRPGIDLIDKLSKMGFDPSKMMEKKRLAIIDATGIKSEERRGIFYVANPGALTDLNMAVASALGSIRHEHGKTWLILDSISTLLVFNAAETVLRFLHTIIGKLRVQECYGVMFAIKGGLEDPIIGTVAHYCDQIITLS
jgi:KaiC/GvpD/RAD55 family RecA-like ATPase